jgi:hypothetical protein
MLRKLVQIPNLYNMGLSLQASTAVPVARITAHATVPVFYFIGFVAV